MDESLLKHNNNEEFISKLGRETDNLYSLSCFFEEYTNINKIYGESLLKLLKKLPNNFGVDSTLQKSISVLADQLNQIANSFIEFSKQMVKEEIKSLNSLHKDFDKKAKSIIKDTNDTISEANELRNKVKEAYDSYVVSNQAVEKTQNSLETLIELPKSVTNEDLLNATEKTLSTRNALTIAKNDYIKFVHTSNEALKSKGVNYNKCLKEMLDLDKSRIINLKKILSSCLKQMEGVATTYLNLIKVIQSPFQSVNAEEDANICFKNLLNKEPKENFKEIKVQLSNEIEFPIREQNGINVRAVSFKWEKGSKDLNTELELKKAVSNLLAGKALSLEEKATTISMINSKNGKYIFGNLLPSIKKQVMVPQDVFKVFWELLNCLLTALTRDRNNKDLPIFISILSTGEKIYTIEENNKRYIFSELVKHKIWSRVDLWKEIVACIIQRHIKINKVLIIKNLMLSKDGKYIKTKGLFSSVFRGEGINKEEIFKDLKNVDKSKVIDLLRWILFYLLKLRVNAMLCAELLNEFQSLYYLTPKTIYELKDILRTLQPFPESEGFLYFNTSIAKLKHQRTLFKYNNSINYFYIGKSLKYISDKHLLFNLLLLSKEGYKILKMRVFKCVLIRLPLAISAEHRVNIWKQILDLNEINVNYNELKEIEIEKQIQENIEIDAQRTMPSNPFVSKNSIINILKAYAVYNKEIKYCQGMSSITGYLYLIFKDEAMAFKALLRVIEKYKMTNMFIQNVPLLKRSLYIMAQLLSDQHSNILKHLKQEDLGLYYFTTRWFMTIFTYTLYSSVEAMPPLILIKIWNAFLVDGWKAIFKVSMYIMNLIEKKAEKVDIRSLLLEFPKKEFIQNNEHVDGLMNYLNKEKVTNTVINCIGIEHDEAQGLEEPKEGERENVVMVGMKEIVKNKEKNN